MRRSVGGSGARRPGWVRWFGVVLVVGVLLSRVGVDLRQPGTEARGSGSSVGSILSGLPLGREPDCTVSRIIDGDTLDCSDGRRIRLLLIDAPERSQGEFGMIATRAMEDLAPVGTVLGVDLDVRRLDPYQRVLAYLVLPDGRMLNEELLRQGVAVVSVHPPNVRHVDRFRIASEAARQAGVGLWAVDGFRCEPADHRAGRCE